jgi:L-alanine-DL-glutamate epimerase-like enolase superfamily enzyme
MKIAKAEILIAREDGPFYVGKHRILLIRLTTDEGIHGIGEAIVYGLGVSTAHALLVDYARGIIGLDPFNTESIWERLHGGWNVQGGPISISAISAIDIALWDIKGKALGVPVYKLLGGKFREKIRVYLSHIEFGYPALNKALDSPEDYFESACAALAKGYDIVKANFMREGGGRFLFDESANKFIAADLLERVRNRVAAVRKALGPTGGIILENNAMTGVDGAIQIAKAVEEFNILFYEEPVEPANPLAMKQVAEKVSFPLASGERMCTRWAFLPFLENGSLRIIQPDICNTGGITEMKKIADLARTYQVLVAPHVCGGPFNHAASVQLEAAIPNFVLHEDHVHLMNEENARYGRYRYEAKDGYLPIPDLPGIGQELSDFGEETMEKIVIQ